MTPGADALEQELCRIPDITAARVVTDDSGDPVEIHVLSLPSKHPKQVVRDVQSVAVARFGLELDHRLISVVQLDTVASGTVVDSPTSEESALPASGERIAVDSVSSTRT